MPPSILHVLFISAIPVGAAFIGATIAALRPPGRVVRSSIQHFAAGVIFSVVAVELLPEVRRGHDPLEVGWTFAAGVVLMLVIDEVVKRFNHGGEHASARGTSPHRIDRSGFNDGPDDLLSRMTNTKVDQSHQRLRHSSSTQRRHSSSRSFLFRAVWRRRRLRRFRCPYCQHRVRRCSFAEA